MCVCVCVCVASKVASVCEFKVSSLVQSMGIQLGGLCIRCRHWLDCEFKVSTFSFVKHLNHMSFVKLQRISLLCDANFAPSGQMVGSFSEGGRGESFQRGAGLG